MFLPYASIALKDHPPKITEVRTPLTSPLIFTAFANKETSISTSRGPQNAAGKSRMRVRSLSYV